MHHIRKYVTKNNLAMLGDEGCLSQMTALVEIELIVHYRGYVKD